MLKKEEKKKLNLLDLISLSLGMIIGAGVMTMMGIAIGFTGRSIIFALGVAAAIILVGCIPQVFISGTAAFPGGYYSMIAALSNKKLAGIYTYINLFTLAGISFFALSFTEYFLTLVPGVNAKVISLLILTILFVMHLLGAKWVARLQNIMMIILAIALAAYIVFGIGDIKPGYFSQPGFMTGGFFGFAVASVYLTFAVGGGQFVINYCSEAKNPTRDIPIAILVSTIGMVIFYAFIAVIASGVLPIEQVANKPLSITAGVFMPKSIYTFFVVGGAMFALLTTLNFSIGNMVYPSMKACDDGWLPSGLTAQNKRFGTYHYILIIIYLSGVIPILFGINMQTAANCTLILTTAIRAVVTYTAMQMPKRIPDLWESSKFHVSNIALNTICVITIITVIFSILLLLVSSPKVEICGNIAILILASALGIVVSKRVELKINYTAR